jgi:hypothetical protein
MKISNLEINLKIQKQNSIFVNKIFYESVDIVLLNDLIDSDLLSTDKCRDDIYENEKAQLIAYKKNYTINGIRVKYSITKSGYGRVSPVKSLSLCSIRREIRHTLAKNNYVDLDIVNCHPVILYQICVKNQIFPIHLKRYVEQRDDVLNDVMNKYNVTKDEAKNLFIRLMYFGSFNKWAEDLLLINVTPTSFILDFQKELLNLSNYILGSNQDLVLELKKTKIGRKSSNNDRGTVVSYFLQEWERRILEHIYLYMIGKNIIGDNLVLCFDGIMIPKDKFYDELIPELEGHLFDKLGFYINIVKKEMNQDIIYKLNEVKEQKRLEIQESEIMNQEYKYFNSDYLMNLKTYQEKKKYFEKFVCKIISPEPCYIFSQEDKISSSRQTYIWSKNNILDAFQQFKIEEDILIDKNGKEKKQSFIKKWINDETLKSYNKLDFIPQNIIQNEIQNIENEQKIYNLFHGFNSIVKTSYNMEKRKDILNIFKLLGRELCGGNDEYFDYLLHFIAHMIQKPNERIPIAFIIKGKQGTGKNVFLSAICNLLDKRNYTISSNPKDFFGDYAEGFYHKLLVNINECEGKDTFEFEGRLKSFISENTITLNAKFMRPITIQNYARLIIFTNKNTPISIDVKSGDRRYVVYQTTDTFLDKRKYNDTFWKKLVEYFEKPEFLAALYDDFNEMKIDDYEFIKNRPITEAYLEMCKQFVPTIALFIEYYIDTLQFNRENKAISTIPIYNTNSVLKENCINYRKEIIEVGTILYQMYTSWSKEMGFIKDREPNIKNFYSSIVESGLPIQKYKSDGMRCLKFIPENVYKNLLSKKWIIDDEKNKTDIQQEIIENVTYDEYFNTF